MRSSAIISSFLLATTASAFQRQVAPKTKASQQQQKQPLHMASSWAEYKNEFIDPSITAADHSSHVTGPHVDQSKRDAADKFWLAQFEDEKEKLHSMNDPWKQTTTRLPSMTTPFDQYEHRFLDPITPEDHESVISNRIDPEIRAKADEFWLQSFLEEKAKLKNKKGATP